MRLTFVGGPLCFRPRSDVRRPRPSSRRALALSGALLLVGALPAWSAPPPLPPGEQEAVNSAIDHGVRFLKATQTGRGTWREPDRPHQLGYAALPGLTLLECGVPKDDRVVQRVATLLRRAASSTDATYEISLAILFLDRLGDPRDERLIQSLALRLIAGQTPTGGWGYKCPRVGPQTGLLLLTSLRQSPQSPRLPEMMKRPAGASLSGTPAPRGRALEGSPVPRPADLTASVKPEEPSLSPERAGHKADELRPAKDPVPPPEPVAIPEKVRKLTVFQDPSTLARRDPLKSRNGGFSGGRFLATTDNSNSQFALLALWVAQRHDLPTDRSLRLLVRRYETSQNPDGSWGYHYGVGGSEPLRPGTMTCVGLLGLAVGHGLANADDGQARHLHDRQIISGFAALSGYVGVPIERVQVLPMQDLYLLWSIERVAVLYDLPTIAGKDWYRWGAQILVANQTVAGSWQKGQYIGNHPVLDTCFALLFLKKANLVTDLTARLRFGANSLNEMIAQKPSSPPPADKPAPPPNPDKPVERPAPPAGPVPPPAPRAEPEQPDEEPETSEPAPVLLAKTLDDRPGTPSAFISQQPVTANLGGPAPAVDAADASPPEGSERPRGSPMPWFLGGITVLLLLASVLLAWVYRRTIPATGTETARPPLRPDRFEPGSEVV